MNPYIIKTIFFPTINIVSSLLDSGSAAFGQNVCYDVKNKRCESQRQMIIPRISLQCDYRDLSRKKTLSQIGQLFTKTGEHFKMHIVLCTLCMWLHNKNENCIGVTQAEIS